MPGYPPISEDLRELLSLLNSHGVEYIVDGAHSLAFHGVPRFTEDIDIFVAKTEENIDRLADALTEFGISIPRESKHEMVAKERGVIFIGHKPNRADFLNFLDGVEFSSAAQSKIAGSLAGQPVYYISLEDYVATKKASGRPKDAGDLIMLKSVHPEIEF
jgi:hypothetical protein